MTALALGMPETSTVDRSLLVRLSSRLPAIAAPCRVRPDVDRLGRDTMDWAVDAGLVYDERTATRLRRIRPEQLAARAFADFKYDDALLAAQWFAWTMLFDDELDEGARGRVPEAVDAVYADVIAALHGSATADREVSPIASAASGLWVRTIPRAGPAWPRRFIAELLKHYSACRGAAADRRIGRMPGVVEYREARSADIGIFLVNLIEPLVRAEVPQALFDSEPWQVLRASTADVVAWCNDIASLPKELASEDVHNYVRVIAHAEGIALPEAAEWLFERIVERIGDMFGAGRALDGELRRLGLDQRTARGVSKVACILLGTARGQLEWLLAASRYRPVP